MFLEIECPKVARGILRMIREQVPRPDPNVDAEYDVGLGWRFFRTPEPGQVETEAHCPMGMLPCADVPLPTKPSDFHLDGETQDVFTVRAVQHFAAWWDSVPEDALEAGIEAVWGKP